MFRPWSSHRRRALVGLLAVSAIALGACSSSAPVLPSLAIPSFAIPAGAGGSPAAADASGGGTSGGDAAIDPCVKLTKADVQPFFSVPIATELPGPTELGKDCEFAGNDGGGGIPSSIDVDIISGDDATTRWQVATSGGQTMFSGVGDQAEHVPNVPDFLAMKGGILCGITSVGYTHLAGKMNYQPGALTDDAATQIAQSYGTLCNKLFGSGNTTPAVTAPPVTDTSGASATPGPSIAVPDQGSTLNGVFPLPAGIDCSGVTATDSSGTVTCSATNTGDQLGVYPFYLTALPGHGYTINSEREAVSQGKEIAEIVFEGPSAGGLSTISIIGTSVTITLQAP